MVAAVGNFCPGVARVWHVIFLLKKGAEARMRDDLAGMPAEEPVKWYLTRDGRQYGPLSDDELRRFRELGHLVATDLLWRKERVREGAMAAKARSFPRPSAACRLSSNRSW
jgi:hypothetical protein